MSGKIFNPLNVIAETPNPEKFDVAAARTSIAAAEAKQTLLPGGGEVGGPGIFNPLESVASSAKFKAEAAMQNTIVGTCAKCQQPMARAVIGNGDSMFYCPQCRVTSPLSDDAL